MKDKSKVMIWLCLTVLVATGLKYVPPYLVEQHKLDLEDHILQGREEAFLHKTVAPAAAVPKTVQTCRLQLL